MSIGGSKMNNINSIYFRPIQKQDYKDLAKLITETWDYGKFCSSKIATQMGKLYLASCLANQTFTCVALQEQKPIGIIMGKNNKTHKCSFYYQYNQAKYALPLLIKKEGRIVANMFSGIEKIDQQLLDSCGKTFDAELAFFAVSEKARGFGIGKALFEQFQTYLKSENLNSFYLYTDVTCNYGFYEHQGLQRLGEQSYSLKPYVDEEFRFFIYGYDGKK